jgi:phosphoribosylglycinamide formyltransferase-1
LVKDFAGRIVNIHPALLPKFGGKGMYGKHVHKAVLEAGETESGITIHFVNEEFDKGEIIAQFETKIDIKETAESLAEKIHDLEMNHFPEVIERIVLSSI